MNICLITIGTLVINANSIVGWNEYYHDPVIGRPFYECQISFGRERVIVRQSCESVKVQVEKCIKTIKERKNENSNNGGFNCRDNNLGDL